MGSNGLTSARHDVFNKYLGLKYPESFDPKVPEKLVYSGSRLLTEKIEGSKLDIGSLVLSPTRTYAPVVQKIFQEVNKVEIPYVFSKRRKGDNGIVYADISLAKKVLNWSPKVSRKEGIMLTFKFFKDQKTSE